MAETQETSSPSAFVNRVATPLTNLISVVINEISDFEPEDQTPEDEFIVEQLEDALSFIGRIDPSMTHAEFMECIAAIIVALKDAKT